LVQPGALLSIVLLVIVYFVSDGLRLHYTLRALGYRLPLPVILRLVFVNQFFSNITPMATGGGFAQVWYLQRHGVPLGHAMAATTIRTVLADSVHLPADSVFSSNPGAAANRSNSPAKQAWLSCSLCCSIWFFS
jgi:uncharacterized protein (TIRG00374 family)